MAHEYAKLRCIDPACAAEFAVGRATFVCAKCAGLLDVVYDWDAAHSALGFGRDASLFGRRLASGLGYAQSGGGAELDVSGVWRFRELAPFYASERQIVTVGEGRTVLQRNDALAREIGLDGGGLFLQYEGLNPSGSFKDNGMAAAFTHARMVGAKRVVCASTGNTSASLAMFGAMAGFEACVLIGSGKIAYGKLSQALDYGARTLQVAGDFDACLARVQEITLGRPELGIYLMNSVNPFRLEGQKAIMFRVLEALGWKAPDWIVVPGGNLGNCSAFAKAFAELKALGMLDRLPRLAVINAQGARTLDRMVNDLGVRWNGGRFDRAKVAAEYQRMDEAGEKAHTVASAIEINRPVNLPKALRALEEMNGVVRSADDATILDHRALVARHGFGCEPASAASLAGARGLLREGVIKPGERVVCIITGHELKDPDATVQYHTGIDMKSAQDKAARGASGARANAPIKVRDDAAEILRALSG